MLNEKEFRVSLKEMCEYESIDELSEALIHKEIETMLVEKTFDQLLEHFESKLNISLEAELINWDFIKEARERRHIIVHNSSIVNKKYIVRTGNPFGFKLKSNVEIDNDYFLSALYEFQFAGILLSYNCWGSWDKDNTNEAIYEMMIQSFNYLNVNRNDFTKRLCTYCKKIEGRNEEQEDCLFRTSINLCIAYKRLDMKAELKKELSNIKIGTASPIFKIAFQILKDDYSNLAENFEKAKLLEELTIDNYLEWPIFEFVRNNEDLHKKLLKTFEEKQIH